MDKIAKMFENIIMKCFALESFKLSSLNFNPGLALIAF